MTAFAARTTGWFTTDDCRLDDFRAVVETSTDLADYPYADEVRENVLAFSERPRHEPPAGPGVSRSSLLITGDATSARPSRGSCP